VVTHGPARVDPAPLRRPSLTFDEAVTFSAGWTHAAEEEIE
jgi:hypothetical protein